MEFNLKALPTIEELEAIVPDRDLIISALNDLKAQVKDFYPDGRVKVRMENNPSREDNGEHDVYTVGLTFPAPAGYPSDTRLFRPLFDVYLPCTGRRVYPLRINTVVGNDHTQPRVLGSVNSLEGLVTLIEDIFRTDRTIYIIKNAGELPK